MRPFFTFILLIMSVYGFAQSGKQKHPDLSYIRKDSIQIVRDRWGVPHVYAPTDAEAAYGLAWVKCEDDFMTLQNFLLTVKGYSGRKSGIEGAKLDYAVAMLRSKELTDREYQRQVSPKFQLYLRAFAAGVNRWVELHPDEVTVLPPNAFFWPTWEPDDLALLIKSPVELTRRFKKGLTNFA